MERTLATKNHAGQTRMTTGFCWKWSDPKPDGTLVDDVVIGEWRRPWNVRGDRRGDREELNVEELRLPVTDPVRRLSGQAVPGVRRERPSNGRRPSAKTSTAASRCQANHSRDPVSRGTTRCPSVVVVIRGEDRAAERGYWVFRPKQSFDQRFSAFWNLGEAVVVPELFFRIEVDGPCPAQRNPSVTGSSSSRASLASLRASSTWSCSARPSRQRRRSAARSSRASAAWWGDRPRTRCAGSRG
jgi:hypothetical protein